jgi:cation transport protein ChaC
VLKLVRQGVGASGANPDYVRSTHEHLLAMGVVDPTLARIMQALG